MTHRLAASAYFPCRIGSPKPTNLKLTSTDIRQAVQTATAGVVAMYFSRFLGLPEGYWAAITAMIVLQASLGAAIREAWVRVAATAIGAAVPMPFPAFLGQGSWVLGVSAVVL